MKVFKLEDMVGGWFVGGFSPSVLSTRDVEVAVKSYKAGDYEPAHYHKLATEITVILKGKARMNGVDYSCGTILLMEPGLPTDFFAINDVVTVVVKHPGALNDKYMVALND